MLHPLIRRTLALILLALAGCSSTIGQKFGGNAQSRSIAVVGDRPLPATVGEPGGQVAAETAEPEPRRNPKARISGRVLDEAGKPVPDAVVRLADGGSRAGRDVRAKTDRSGAFTLGGLRPGSSYWLIAEVDDTKGLRTGRVRARTAEIGVEISLGDDGDQPTPVGERPGRTSRARPISDREEVEHEPSRVNDEDLALPADEAGAVLSPDDRKPRSGDTRPRLSAPEPSVGWRKPGDPAPAARQARRDSDSSDPEPADEPRPGPSRRDPTAVDDGPDPLPPAIEPGRKAEIDEANPPPRASRSRRRPPPPDAEPGGLSLPVETPPDDPEPPAPKYRSPRKSRSESGPPPMPSIDSAGLGGELGVYASIPPSRLDPDRPPVLEDIASPPDRGEAVALHDPPKAEGSPLSATDPTPILATKPAPEPAFASSARAPVPASDPSEAYNPFALVGSAQAEPPATVLLTASPAASVPSQLGSLEPEPAPVASPAPPEAPAPRKWGEVAPTPARTRVVAEAARPTSLFARFRTPSTTSEKANDPSIALCEFDPGTRKLVDFRLPDLEGKPVRFVDLDADFVLIDFWGTWCKPCLDSIPHLVELQKQYGPRRLKVVGIACEKSGPDGRVAKVAGFARKLGINYTVLLSAMDGSCPVQKALRVRYYPTMILLDRNGQVLWNAEGATPANLERLDRALASSSRREVARR